MGKTYTCPHCGEEIKTILFREVGSLVYNGAVKRWVRDFPFSDADFWCCVCEGKLEFNDLEFCGIF